MTNRLINANMLPDLRGVVLHYENRPPTVSDNQLPEGAIWLDRVGNEAYILTNRGSTPGAAQWDQFSVSIPITAPRS